MSDDPPSESHLETGWDRTTPANDTVIRQIILAQAEDAISVITALGGRVERNDRFLAADLGRPATYHNAAVLLHPLTAETVDSVMRELNAFFDIDGTATGFCGIFTVWQYPDLRPWGWQLMGHPPAHLLPAGKEPASDPDGVSFHTVSTAEELREWDAGARASFLSDMPEGSLVDPAILDDRRRHSWIARVDGQTAGVASSFAADGMNYVSLVGTIPEFRRRGIGAALTWRASLVEPRSPACLLSSDEGRPTYDRMGFVPLIRCTLWYRNRG